jgi:hypothetical protein
MVTLFLLLQCSLCEFHSLSFSLVSTLGIVVYLMSNALNFARFRGHYLTVSLILLEDQICCSVLTLHVGLLQMFSLNNIVYYHSQLYIYMYIYIYIYTTLTS